uniref:Phospholipid scramblase n=1 Tax=Erpetoichthys calabaricus TaxID=27687 RepID=A0A8C4RS25_ERPCA
MLTPKCDKPSNHSKSPKHSLSFFFNTILSCLWALYESCFQLSPPWPLTLKNTRVHPYNCMSCTRKFQLKNSMGKMMYFATQTNIYQSANFRGYQQGFEMNIYDHSKREVIHLIQPFICSLIFCSWNIQQMEVQAPVGVVAGYVKETHHPTTYRFTIHDSAGETALSCFLKIFDRTWKSKIGTISTQYFLDNFGDTLSIQFPKDLDVKLKAVILGASILIENKCLSTIYSGLLD